MIWLWNKIRDVPASGTSVLNVTDPKDIPPDVKDHPTVPHARETKL